MRLGGSICEPYNNASQWLKLVKNAGYSCVTFPVNCEADQKTIDEYLTCCRDHDLVIGEVGIWRNLFSRDPAEGKKNFEYSIRQLELAEYVGANCCVNISGSMGLAWDGYHADNYLQSTYDRVVNTTQRIIDAVQPVHTAYSLEPMPWMCPDSPEQYLQLIRDVDRPAFRVHMDYTNMINSLERYRLSDAFIRHCFTLLAPYICSVHLKDAKADETALPCCILEARPGEGELPLVTVLKECEKLGRDIPVFTEHMATQADYDYATAYLKKLARDHGIEIL